MVGFELLLGCWQGCCYIFDFCVDLISLLLQITFAFWVLLDLFVIFAYLSYSFKVLMIILNDCNIRLFLFVFKLIFTFFLFLFLLFFFLLIFISLTFFLLLLELGLLFQFVDALSFSYFVVMNDALSHFVVIRINKLTQNLFLLFVFFLKLFIEFLHLADFRC